MEHFGLAWNPLFPSPASTLREGLRTVGKYLRRRRSFVDPRRSSGVQCLMFAKRLESVLCGVEKKWKGIEFIVVGK